MATAIDSCGNSASASALAVAVGGKCPITCQDAVNNVRSAASKSGCGSPAYNDATLAAVGLCGTDQYNTLSAGICPAPDCGAAIATAQAAATAGCNSLAYAAAIATARNACGAAAFASAAATAIGGRCPLDCPTAVSQAQGAD